MPFTDPEGDASGGVQVGSDVGLSRVGIGGPKTTSSGVTGKIVTAGAAAVVVANANAAKKKKAAHSANEAKAHAHPKRTPAKAKKTVAAPAKKTVAAPAKKAAATSKTGVVVNPTKKTTGSSTKLDAKLSTPPKDTPVINKGVNPKGNPAPGPVLQPKPQPEVKLPPTVVKTDVVDYPDATPPGRRYQAYGSTYTPGMPTAEIWVPRVY